MTTPLNLAGSPRKAATATPLITEEEYQLALRKAFGEEMAAICNLPYPKRIKAIAVCKTALTRPVTKFGQPKDIPALTCLN